MVCRLCLDSATDPIDIFSDFGEELAIPSILEKHFWFRPEVDDAISTVICSQCWLKVFNFHEFYIQVEEAHRSLNGQHPITAPSKGGDVKVFHGDSENTVMLPELRVVTKLSQEDGDEALLIPVESAKDEEKDLFEDLEESTQGSLRRSKRSCGKTAVSPTVKRRGRPRVKKEIAAAEETQEEVILLEISPEPVKDANLTKDENPDNNEEEFVMGNEADYDFTDLPDDTIDDPADSLEPPQSSPASSPKPSAEPLRSKRKRKLTKVMAAHKRKTVRRSGAADSGEKSDKTTTDEDIDEASPKRKQHSSEREESSREIKSRQVDEMIAKVLKLHCAVCTEEQQNFSVLKRHMKQVHQTPVYIMCCNKRFTKRCYLAEHIVHHLDPDRYRCKECDKVFSDMKNLNNHTLSKHQSYEDRAFQCPKCPKKFALAAMMEQHLLLHGDRIYKCEICQNGYPTPFKLNWHVKIVHDNFGIMCEICAKVLRGRAAFDRHQLEHSGVKLPRVQCEICSSWLQDKRSLKKHMARHNEAGIEYKCPECGKNSANQSALTHHIRYAHTLKPKHVCNVCNKGFKKADYLKEHMTTHTGEVLYTCTFCPRTFNSRANMYSHRKKMHPAEYEEHKRKRFGESIPDVHVTSASQPKDGEQSESATINESNEFIQEFLNLSQEPN